MEAPEKIYLYPSDRAGEEYEEEWGDKAWGEDYVEYTRTDAFIEKACEWLRENKDKYLYNIGRRGEYIPTCSNKIIDDFRNYMKGE